MGKKSREKRERRQPVVHPPSRFAEIIDAASERDREFFENHPGQEYCLRPYVPGEFWIGPALDSGEPPLAQDSWVLVRQVAPGIRMRRPVSVPASIPRGPQVLTMPWEDEPIVAWVEPWPGY